MSASDVIVIGIGPGSEVKTFLTFGLDIGAANPVWYRGNSAAVAFRDKRAGVTFRDKRVPVVYRDKRREVEAT